MKDYLKEPVSLEEKAEIISIIYRVARKHKLKIYNERKIKVALIEDLDLSFEDEYEFDNNQFQAHKDSLSPLSEEQKSDIVNRLNKLLDDLCLFDLKRTLTFNEKLVFFLFSVERYKQVEIMTLLSVSKKTVYNRQKSVEAKIKKMKGEL